MSFNRNRRNDDVNNVNAADRWRSPSQGDEPPPAFPAWAWWRANIQMVYGFVGWYVVNGLFWLAMGNPSFNTNYNFFTGLFTLPVNLIVLIVLAVMQRTRKIALGMLAAIAVNLVLSLALGVFINGVCFAPFYLK